MQDEWRARIRANPLKWFRPTGKQEEHIAGVGSGKHRICVFSGGNRAGKSACGFNILGNIINGVQIPEFDHPIFRNWPYPKKGRIGSTAKNLSPEIGVIDDGIKTWWPAGTYKGEKQSHPYNVLYKCANGWVVDVMSYEQKLTEWESVQLGFCYYDEPPPLSVFNATIARMEAGGMVFIHMTPLDEAGPIFDILENNPDVLITYVDIEDSCKVHGINGFLEHENIENMVSLYDEDEKDARAHGKPQHLSGCVYKTFNPIAHIVETDKEFEIPKEWPIINIVDPHDAYPFAISWAAISPEDDYYIFREWPDDPFESIKGTKLDFDGHKEIILNKEQGRSIGLRLIDPNFGNKTYGNTKRTVKQELSIRGLTFVDAPDNLALGHGKVKLRLKYDTSKPIDLTNKPKIFIFKSCRNHRVSIAKYSYDKKRSGDNKDKTLLQEKYKDFADVIRYLCAYEPRYADFPQTPIDKLAHLDPSSRKAWEWNERHRQQMLRDEAEGEY